MESYNTYSRPREIEGGKVYRADIDLLKGFAILAVVLYHMGISRSGYLGVDVFFVISGFLIVPNVIRNCSDGKFHYLSFIEKRVMRLLPLMLIASLLSLIVGYYGMLPDDYENLGESVVATNFFSNNILASITTRNYWYVGNDYNPLMHTWYIGILFEFYLVFPLIVMLVNWLSRKLYVDFNKYVIITVLALSVVSFLLYLNPSITTGDRFYLFPFRFFEIAFGGLAGVWIKLQRNDNLLSNGFLSGFSFVMLFLVLFVGIFYVEEQKIAYNLVEGGVKSGESFIPQNLLLLLTVILTLFLIVSDNMKSRLILMLIKSYIFCLFGMMSYSIFIWHQPILAFIRYFVTSVFSPLLVLIYFIVVLTVSYVSYRFVEQKVRNGMLTRIVMVFCFIFVNSIAFVVFLRAGIVRDVPELYVSMNGIHSSILKEYIDRIYEYDKDFPKSDNGKINVLIIGNSFARDWANILLESKMANKINISYLYEFEEKNIDRVKKADYVFIFDWKHNVSYYIWENLRSDAEVWGIGTKNFGENNRLIYKDRNLPDYFKKTISIDRSFIKMNEMLKEEWKDKYIDLINSALIDNERVAVFSSDHKFISPDTKHLSKAGAEFYADKIDFCKIFDKKKYKLM